MANNEIEIDGDVITLSMTFHESYGEVPVIVLGAIKRHRVTPAEWYLIEAVMGDDWERIYSHIVANSQYEGGYRQPFPLT